MSTNTTDGSWGAITTYQGRETKAGPQGKLMIGGQGVISFHLQADQSPLWTLQDFLKQQQQLQTQKCPDGLLHLNIQLQHCFLNLLNHKCHLYRFLSAGSHVLPLKILILRAW